MVSGSVLMASATNQGASILTGLVGETDVASLYTITMSLIWIQIQWQPMEDPQNQRRRPLKLLSMQLHHPNADHGHFRAEKGDRRTNKSQSWN